MKLSRSSLLFGDVVHQRVQPVRHKLRYQTFSVLLDLDDIDGATASCHLFSHNRWNILSFFERDHADGLHENLAHYARDRVARELDIKNIGKVFLMTYPRVFGYVFNPLSVYFCHEKGGDCVALIFEVSNTFGGRKSYVQRIVGNQVENADKKFLVSPFNRETGKYSFRADQVGEYLTLGVALRENDNPVLNTWYRVQHAKLSDWQILNFSLRRPVMTLKVVAAIHFEAIKLWLKGLRFPKVKPTA